MCGLIFDGGENVTAYKFSSTRLFVATEQYAKVQQVSVLAEKWSRLAQIKFNGKLK